MEAPALDACTVDAGTMDAAGAMADRRVSWGHNRACERQTDREGRHTSRDSLKFVDKKIVLPGGSKDGLNMLPAFDYAKE
jgi:hypothetical protein